MSPKTNTVVSVVPATDLAAEIAALRAENAALKAKAAAATFARMGLKVSDKGALSLYGIGRFPVTLYKSQWEAVINFIPTIKEFIQTHESELAVKENK